MGLKAREEHGVATPDMTSTSVKYGVSAGQSTVYSINDPAYQLEFRELTGRDSTGDVELDKEIIKARAIQSHGGAYGDLGTASTLRHNEEVGAAAADSIYPSYRVVEVPGKSAPVVRGAAELGAGTTPSTFDEQAAAVNQRVGGKITAEHNLDTTAQGYGDDLNVEGNERANQLLAGINADNFEEVIRQLPDKVYQVNPETGYTREISLKDIQIVGADATLSGLAEPVGYTSTDPGGHFESQFREGREISSAKLRELAASGELTFNATPSADVAVISRPVLYSTENDPTGDNAEHNQRETTKFNNALARAEAEGKIVAIRDPMSPLDTAKQVADLVVPGFGVYGAVKLHGEQTAKGYTTGDERTRQNIATGFAFLDAVDLIGGAGTAGKIAVKSAVKVAEAGGKVASKVPVPVVGVGLDGMGVTPRRNITHSTAGEVGEEVGEKAAREIAEEGVPSPGDTPSWFEPDVAPKSIQETGVTPGSPAPGTSKPDLGNPRQVELYDSSSPELYSMPDAQSGPRMAGDADKNVLSPNNEPYHLNEEGIYVPGGAPDVSPPLSVTVHGSPSQVYTRHGLVTTQSDLPAVDPGIAKTGPSQDITVLHGGRSGGRYPTGWQQESPIPEMSPRASRLTRLFGRDEIIDPAKIRSEFSSDLYVPPSVERGTGYIPLREDFRLAPKLEVPPVVFRDAEGIRVRVVKDEITGEQRVIPSGRHLRQPHEEPLGDIRHGPDPDSYTLGWRGRLGTPPGGGGAGVAPDVTPSPTATPAVLRGGGQPEPFLGNQGQPLDLHSLRAGDRAKAEAAEIARAQEALDLADQRRADIRRLYGQESTALGRVATEMDPRQFTSMQQDFARYQQQVADWEARRSATAPGVAPAPMVTTESGLQVPASSVSPQYNLDELIDREMQRVRQGERNPYPGGKRYPNPEPTSETYLNRWRLLDQQYGKPERKWITVQDGKTESRVMTPREEQALRQWWHDAKIREKAPVSGAERQFALEQQAKVDEMRQKRSIEAAREGWERRRRLEAKLALEAARERIQERSKNAAMGSAAEPPHGAYGIGPIRASFRSAGIGPVRPGQRRDSRSEL